MTIEPLKSEELKRTLDGASLFVTQIERSIEELEENLRKLYNARSLLKTQFLGEEIPVGGLKKAMDAAGPVAVSKVLGVSAESTTT